MKSVMRQTPFSLVISPSISSRVLVRVKLILAVVSLAVTTQGFASDLVVGKPLLEAASMLGLELSRSTIISEPPAVVRGLYFKSPQGVEVQLFIRRGQLPLTFEGGDNLELYKSLEVIGFRKVEDGNVSCKGEVLWHFKC